MSDRIALIKERLLRITENQKSNQTQTPTKQNQGTTQKESSEPEPEIRSSSDDERTGSSSSSSKENENQDPKIEIEIDKQNSSSQETNSESSSGSDNDSSDDEDSEEEKKIRNNIVKSSGTGRGRRQGPGRRGRGRGRARARTRKRVNGRGRGRGRTRPKPRPRNRLNNQNFFTPSQTVKQKKRIPNRTSVKKSQTYSNYPLKRNKMNNRKLQTPSLFRLPKTGTSVPKGVSNFTCYITEGFIKKKTKIQDLHEIKELNLHLEHKKEGKIRYIENLDKLKNLTYLDLSENMIETISNLDKNRKLIHLDLSGNMITKIENINHLTKLQHLDFSNNSITRIRKNSVSKLQAVEYLDLSSNKLEHLNDLLHFKELYNLKSLNVLDNPISELPHYQEFIVYHLRTIETLNGSKIKKDFRSQAKDRFDMEEIKKLEQLVADRDKEIVQLKKRNSKLRSDNKELRIIEDNYNQDMEIMEKDQKRLRNQLESKSRLLQKKTHELTKTCELLYEVQQELAFYKIDQSFSGEWNELSGTIHWKNLSKGPMSVISHLPRKHQGIETSKPIPVQPIVEQEIPSSDEDEEILVERQPKPEEIVPERNYQPYRALERDQNKRKQKEILKSEMTELENKIREHENTRPLVQQRTPIQTKNKFQLTPRKLVRPLTLRKEKLQNNEILKSGKIDQDKLKKETEEMLLIIQESNQKRTLNEITKEPITPRRKIIKREIERQEIESMDPDEDESEPEPEPEPEIERTLFNALDPFQEHLNLEKSSIIQPDEQQIGIEKINPLTHSNKMRKFNKNERNNNIDELNKQPPQYEEILKQNKKIIQEMEIIKNEKIKLEKQLNDANEKLEKQLEPKEGTKIDFEPQPEKGGKGRLDGGDPNVTNKELEKLNRDLKKQLANEKNKFIELRESINDLFYDIASKKADSIDGEVEDQSIDVLLDALREIFEKLEEELKNQEIYNDANLDIDNKKKILKNLKDLIDKHLKRKKQLLSDIQNLENDRNKQLNDLQNKNNQELDLSKSLRERERQLAEKEKHLDQNFDEISKLRIDLLNDRKEVQKALQNENLDLTKDNNQNDPEQSQLHNALLIIYEKLEIAERQLLQFRRYFSKQKQQKDASNHLIGALDSLEEARFGKENDYDNEIMVLNLGKNTSQLRKKLESGIDDQETLNELIDLKNKIGLDIKKLLSLLETNKEIKFEIDHQINQLEELRNEFDLNPNRSPFVGSEQRTTENNNIQEELIREKSKFRTLEREKNRLSKQIFDFKNSIEKREAECNAALKISNNQLQISKSLIRDNDSQINKNLVKFIKFNVQILKQLPFIDKQLLNNDFGVGVDVDVDVDVDSDDYVDNNNSNKNKYRSSQTITTTTTQTPTYSYSPKNNIYTKKNVYRTVVKNRKITRSNPRFVKTELKKY
ncbi:hypothetical protein M0813_20687 [Anaeramoeba flamelloides]|uniref:Uncharacterized protein n=1 Tax=Anaeramoeba flamelloides TaxID=1746091 RepID=A0ABQ8YKA3_9EUKA|nr:hypothetical protein M0813_20687 [Anaeramoeba flamelloides]